MKLTLVLFKDQSDVYLSTIHKDVVSDFDIAYRDGYDEDCKELPSFTVTWFYRKSVGWFEYKGDYYVFVSCQLNQQELGRIEHCIYTLTGLRGTGNHIDKLEFLASPNVPMKKFLMKRV